MSKLYDDLMTGFNEILEAQKTGKTMKSTTIIIPDVKKYNNMEIRKIRAKTGMTQAIFASYMGVSKKTVEAWERGVNHPTGPACRLLSILDTGEIIKIS